MRKRIAERKGETGGRRLMKGSKDQKVGSEVLIGICEIGIFDKEKKLYSRTFDAIRQMAKRSQIEADFHFFDSFESIEDFVLQGGHQKMILFSNFPRTNPEGSRKRFKRIGELGYHITKAFFRDLLEAAPKTTLHIITGARAEYVPDEAIKSVAKHSHITIARKNQFGLRSVFANNYAAYVMELLKQDLGSPG